MIGQENIKSWLENCNNFPHFIVLIGERGSGKRTVSKYIASKLSMVYSECEIRTEAVREVIDSAYKSTTKVLYTFADADVMKVQAKNAMLKITEESPENAYFCLTVCDDSTLLDTIKSRAYVIYLENYTNEELAEYYYTLTESENKEECELFSNICSTPGEIDLLTKYGVEFYDYVKLVADNIAEVEPANAFKSSCKLAIKGDEGYDLKLFWKVFLYGCTQTWWDKRWAKCAIITCKYLNKVEKVGVNKQQLYDMWVMDIRGALLE